MTIEIPESASEVVARSKADVQRELAQSNPFLKNSWLGAIVTASAHRIFDFYLQLKSAMLENFPDTATGDFLIRWAAIWGKQQQAASQSTGVVVATGTAGGTIPLGAVLALSTGNYTSTSSAVVSAQSIIVASITRAGQAAEVTTTSDHGLANNVPVTISGSDQSEYNVTDTVITVTGLDTFAYAVSGTPTTPATGAILAAFTAASVAITSDDFGDDTNLSAGAELKLQSPIVNVDDSLLVNFGAIGGGVDIESDTSLRLRMLDRIQNPVAHFNESDIIDKAKEVPGVTRVFVQSAGTNIGAADITSITRSGNVATATLAVAADFQSGQTVSITGAVQADYNVTDSPVLVESTTIFHYIVENAPTSPATGTITSTVTVPIGQVRVFFMRDNDDNPIPSGSEIIPVRAKIEEILPANTDEANDLFVLAPTAVPVGFTFTSLAPNTASMRAAITANMRQFFDESTIVGIDIDEDAYRAAIFNTVDSETGAVVASFGLSAPSGDIAITSGEIGALGNMVYS